MCSFGTLKDLEGFVLSLSSSEDGALKTPGSLWPTFVNWELCLEFTFLSWFLSLSLSISLCLSLSLCCGQ